MISPSASSTRASNRSAGERLTLIAVGGYGRGEMAPHSATSTSASSPRASRPRWTEQVIEAMLYLLWDLGLKVGHSTRSRRRDDPRRARATSRSAPPCSKARYIWGDQALYDEAVRALPKPRSSPAPRAPSSPRSSPSATSATSGWATAATSSSPTSRKARAACATSTRCSGSANMSTACAASAELVEAGLLTGTRATPVPTAPSASCWAVRCHLHSLAGRAEERLTFDYPARDRGADAITPTGRANRAVERFMQFYFLHAKSGRRPDRRVPRPSRRAARGTRAALRLPTIRRRPGKLKGFVLDRGRLALPADDFFSADPVRLIEMFALADEHGLEIHPQAMRAGAARRQADRRAGARRSRAPTPCSSTC